MKNNFRLALIVLAIAYLVFGAGAVFTGYKPTTFHWATACLIALNLAYLIMNRPSSPTPPTPKI